MSELVNIRNTPAFYAIQRHYGERTASRSGVPLINHINEGIRILEKLGAESAVKEAFAIHPLFQGDDDLRENHRLALLLEPMVVMYAMEYRNVANAFLSDQIDVRLDNDGREIAYDKKPLRLSPLPAVNLMLTADKVQNRKDFIAYHQATHARSRELTFYFDLWLRQLGVSDARYEELTRDL